METSLLERGAFDSLSSIIETYYESARSNLKKLEDDGLDSLHDFRVSVRRLHVWFKVCDDREIADLEPRAQKKLKRLVKITNNARDTETRLAIFKQHFETQKQNENDAAHELIRKWESDIRHEYKDIVKLVPKVFAKIDPAVKEILEHLEKLQKKADDEMVFEDWVRLVWIEHAVRLDVALKSIVSIDDQSKIHEARILGKKLRYLLEPCSGILPGLSSLLRDLRQLQDLSGGLRDAHMLENELDEDKNLEAVVKRNQKEMVCLFDELQRKFLNAPARNFERRVENLC